MKKLLLTITLILIQYYSLACAGGIASGSITPTLSYQTISTQNGRYYTLNVTNCTQYEFTFCAGGAVSSTDTQLTLLNSLGTSELVYSDDVCGVNASIVWTATFTGTIRILISKYNCNHDLTANVTMAYRMTSGSGGNCFSLAGSATNEIIGGQNCIQLTPETNNQTGCAWSGSTVNFNNSFSLSLNAYFGNNISGADGTTYVFTPNLPSNCGQIGGQLGAGGIANSLIVEFDTYDNDFPTHLYDMSGDHVAIETDGDLQGPGAPYCGPVFALPSGANLDDGNIHVISINWNAVTQTLSVFVDGYQRLTCSGNFVSTVFGGNNMVHWGATASTGGLNNQQYFCSSYIALPLVLIDFRSDCLDNKEIITWITDHEVQLKEFVLEYTSDGELFFPVETMAAKGTDEALSTYSFEVNNLVQNQVYYRLTMIDNNGHVSYSDLISSKKCNGNSDIHSLAGYMVVGDELKLLFTDEYEVVIYDMSGKMIGKGVSSEEGLWSITKPATGMYIVTAMNPRHGIEQQQRIFVE